MATSSQQATTKRRIALYGGAFDPVHRAHIAAARAALEQMSLDKVIFIPAAQSPLKANRPNASDSDRLKMLELATKEEPRFEIDASELKRGGVSYTVDTVRHFSECEPDAELFWIIGADQLEQLDQWHAIEDLAERVTFLVLARPGYRLSAPSIPGLVWKEVSTPLMEESSSSIREKIANGLPLDSLLSPSVEAFIHAEGLYTNEKY